MGAVGGVGCRGVASCGLGDGGGVQEGQGVALEGVQPGGGGEVVQARQGPQGGGRALGGGEAQPGREVVAEVLQDGTTEVPSFNSIDCGRTSPAERGATPAQTECSYI